jgi:hypothetical protein
MARPGGLGGCLGYDFRLLEPGSSAYAYYSWIYDSNGQLMSEGYASSMIYDGNDADFYFAYYY